MQSMGFDLSEVGIFGVAVCPAPELQRRPQNVFRPLSQKVHESTVCGVFWYLSTDKDLLTA